MGACGEVKGFRVVFRVYSSILIDRTPLESAVKPVLASSIMP
jgi:hypothetical protein